MRNTDEEVHMRKFVSTIAAAALSLSVMSPALADHYGRRDNGAAIVAFGLGLAFGVIAGAANQPRYDDRRYYSPARRYHDDRPYWSGGQSGYGHWKGEQVPRYGRSDVRCGRPPAGARWRNNNENGRIGFVNCSDGSIRYYYYR